MPRALTEQEKCRQCQRLLDKGKSFVLSHGIKKVSIDDIAKAADMAKGTFYQHFESKEKYLLALIEDIHKHAFAKSEQMIIAIFEGQPAIGRVGGEPNEKNTKGQLAAGISERSSGTCGLRAGAREFFKNLFIMPEMAFFIQNEPDIEKLLLDMMEDEDIREFKQMEAGMFEKLLRSLGVDTNKIKPGVVHNILHTLYLTMSCDLMTADDLPETVNLLTDCLITYIF